MKVLVFASTPPPHHGQAYMIQLILEGLGGDQRKRASASGPIQCFHVHPGLSDDLTDIGSVRPKKALRLVRAIFEALWCRFRYGADVFYCVPGMALRGSVIKDVVYLPVLRPFFKKTVLHWQSTGLGEWVSSPSAPPMLARCARYALKNVDLTIATAEFNLADARVFSPRLSVSIPNATPDPCPDYDTTIGPARTARQRFLHNLIKGSVREADESTRTIKLLFMALCTEDKGLLDAVEAIHLLNSKSPSPDAQARFHLTVAGKFLNEHEEQKFRAKVKSLALEKDVTYAGFVAGEEKRRLLLENDLFCFPTYYSAESFPVVLVEAMAYGLPIVTTSWRCLPELFPPNYPGVVNIKRPREVASAVLEVLKFDCSNELRKAFLANYTAEEHLRQLRTALLKVDPATKG